jgi:hypothetical protein
MPQRNVTPRDLRGVRPRLLHVATHDRRRRHVKAHQIEPHLNIVRTKRQRLIERRVDLRNEYQQANRVRRFRLGHHAARLRVRVGGRGCERRGE